ncbi:VanZ family protein [Anaeromicropila herbilytica]|uniref:VanZ family protein n=1 Tax=Anaeromicropila herbilytica TaxID=2785025 RepID=A0A7R7IF42_9FIRM|nr:VanZ family protein [Anaeromicropila herbilytica]BCN32706.1 VanZ family protein [Anaeromicropila herbilytica]
MNEFNRINKLTIILFIIYLIAIFEIIVFKLELPFSQVGQFRNINFIPFHESMIVNGQVNYSEIIMNIIIFIPLGIYVEMIFSRWSTFHKVIISFLVSLMCEVLQYIFALGASDITDIINNTLGGIIGLLIIKVLIKLFNNRSKVYRFINVVATIGTVVMGLLLAILIIANR